MLLTWHLLQHLKNNTLNKFGIEQKDGKFKPFHLYSMKQAIEEGFILDVLSELHYIQELLRD